MSEASTLPPISALDPEVSSVGWMFASHYHCRNCKAEVAFWGRLPWKTAMGVRAVGACKRCSLIMIEPENGVPLWVNIPFEQEHI
jgi:hypothetical protein